jgi:glutamine---fructose-6-phosphate transaminase (isomerizing)
MAAEMAAQPEVLARVTERAPAEAAAVRGLVPDPLAGVVFLARGSSDNAAVFGRYLVELRAGRPAGLAAPSIYTRYHATVDWRGYLVVALSQSGATPEIVSTCRAMREAGARILGISNEPHSPLADSVDRLLDTAAGPERAIPATKTVTAQFAVLVTVAAGLSPGSASPAPALRARPRPASPAPALRARPRPASPALDLDGLPGAVAAVLGDPGPARRLADRWQGIDRLVVAGRGLAYAAALETALKVKETTGILAEGISTADLLHGPIAAVYAGAPVLLVDGGGPADSDLADLRVLLAGRGAGAECLPVPPGLPETAHVITSIARGQQLAMELALARHADPDAPAHLSKVTATT